MGDAKFLIASVPERAHHDGHALLVDPVAVGPGTVGSVVANRGAQQSACSLQPGLRVADSSGSGGRMDAGDAIVKSERAVR